jgi:hypothetical protein
MILPTSTHLVPPRAFAPAKGRLPKWSDLDNIWGDRLKEALKEHLKEKGSQPSPPVAPPPPAPPEPPPELLPPELLPKG